MYAFHLTVHFLRFMSGCMSFQIWVEKLGVYVWVRELRMLELCSVHLPFSTQLSCNFCRKQHFLTQDDLCHHLYMAHNVAQCRKPGCYRLLNDVLSRDFHENVEHTEWAKGCVCVHAFMRGCMFVFVFD